LRLRAFLLGEEVIVLAQTTAVARVGLAALPRDHVAFLIRNSFCSVSGADKQ
jgi:hypothetical protein